MTGINLGQMNHLRVIRADPNGLVLAIHPDDATTVFLSRREADAQLSVGDEVDMFVYSDSSERYLATTRTPKAMVGEIAHLEVVAVNPTGAFLDWGLPKDLLLPYGEQRGEVAEGMHCTVFIHKDQFAERAVASQRLNRHIGKSPADYQPGEEVAIDVIVRTDLGYKVVVNHRHWGLLYDNEVFEPLKRGFKTTAWVKKVVADDKVDLSLYPPKKERIDNASQSILTAMENAGGFLPLHDKSPPGAIRERFGMSKKNFKAAVGKLYKARLITLDTDGIRLEKSLETTE
jgi:predicted RNA-binding protein (virulence factor B family)